MSASHPSPTPTPAGSVLDGDPRVLMSVPVNDIGNLA